MAKQQQLEPWADLSGKVVMVTGASSGLGREFCLDLAKAGCRIVAAARRVDRLKCLCDDVNGLTFPSSKTQPSGPRAVAVELDVCADGGIIQSSVKTAWDAFGRIDALISSAGVRGLGQAFRVTLVVLDSNSNIPFIGLRKKRQVNAIKGEFKDTLTNVYVSFHGDENGFRLNETFGSHSEQYILLGNELCGGGIAARVEVAQYGKNVIALKNLGVVDGITYHIYNLGPGDDPNLITKIRNPFYLNQIAQTYKDITNTMDKFGPWSEAWFLKQVELLTVVTKMCLLPLLMVFDKAFNAIVLNDENLYTTRHNLESGGVIRSNFEFRDSLDIPAMDPKLVDASTPPLLHPFHRYVNIRDFCAPAHA
ncbi:hypothetical protein PTKIN_Ptkin16aG0060900 [Pterospermum kingtungense]